MIRHNPRANLYGLCIGGNVTPTGPVDIVQKFMKGQKKCCIICKRSRGEFLTLPHAFLFCYLQVGERGGKTRGGGRLMRPLFRNVLMDKVMTLCNADVPTQTCVYDCNYIQP